MLDTLVNDWKSVVAATLGVLLYMECGRVMAGWAYARSDPMDKEKAAGRTLLMLAWPFLFLAGLVKAMTNPD